MFVTLKYRYVEQLAHQWVCQGRVEDVRRLRASIAFGLVDWLYPQALVQDVIDEGNEAIRLVATNTDFSHCLRGILPCEYNHPLSPLQTP